MLWTILYALLALVVLQQVYWFLCSRFHRFRRLYDPYTWIPFVGTMYVEAHPENRVVLGVNRFLAHHDAQPQSPRLYTEHIPVFGRVLVVADASVAVKLLMEMGKPDALLERDRTLHSIYQTVFMPATPNTWGEPWQWRRKAVQALFTGRAIFGSLFEFILHQIEREIFEPLDEAARSGQSIALVPLMSNLTLSVILYHLFGGFNHETFPVARILHLVDQHQQVLMERLVLPSVIANFLNGKKLSSIRAEYQSIVLEPMRDALREHMGVAYTASKEARHDEESLLSECLMLIFAGYETTASSVSMAIGQLIKHPEEYKKVRDEVDQVFEQGPLTAKSSAQLIYLTAAYNESLRILPPVGTNIFEVRRDGEVMSVPVKKGDKIAIGHYACSRDKKVYGNDVEAFRPERYLVSSNELEADAEAVRLPQMAFSNGAHNCLGKNLALLESRLIMSSIIHRYDFKFVDPNYKVCYGVKGKAIPPPVDNLPVFVTFRSDR